MVVREPSSGGDCIYILKGGMVVGGIYSGGECIDKLKVSMVVRAPSSGGVCIYTLYILKGGMVVRTSGGDCTYIQIRGWYGGPGT